MTRQLDKIAFAILNADPASPERNTVLEKLGVLKQSPKDALTAAELMEMHGLPCVRTEI